MSKTPKDGGAPSTGPKASRRRAAVSDSQRLQSPNTVGPSPSRVRDERPQEAPSRRRRDRAAGRPRDSDAAPGERRNHRARSSAEHEPQRAPVNTIRPTPRRIRAAPPPLRDASAPEGRAPADEQPRAAAGKAEGAHVAALDRHTVPEDIKRRFVQIGKKYHFPDGARAFTDHGNRLTSPSENTEVIKSLISIAQARGWSDISISGTERFRREAWLAARLAGLEARGYSPTEFEQGRLVRTLARVQAQGAQRPGAGLPRGSPPPPDGQTVDTSPGNSQAEGQGARHERQRTLQVGRLVDHGAAPYLHDPRNDMSYFVRIETPRGEREIWGVDLHRALKRSLTRPQIGDEIGLRTFRQDAVRVARREYDAEGRVIDEKPLGARRNAWIVEKREFFRERAQAARVLRDPSVDRQAVVKQHPELLGTYLQLHAAELAAKTFRNPDDQRRFVASVRAALADSVARGEPLPTVPLKEKPAQPREPHAPSAPAARERATAPVR